MKRILHLLASVMVLLSMLTMPIAITSCNNDEDLTDYSGDINPNDFDWSKVVEEIPAKEGAKIYAINGINAYTIIVKSAKDGLVYLDINGTEIKLSQKDGYVYVSTSVRAWTAEDAKALPRGVLLQLKPFSTLLQSGKLSTVATVKKNSTETYFVYAN
ncbi:MAG: hypothetical protein MJZ23_10500 [Paludibacteraceae bacterium]|nr:hypothetical protein [Paludibacteraceae bacterium]